MNSAISYITYGDNERSRLSGIGSKGNWLSWNIVKCHVWETKNMISDYEWMLN